jgi:hypothetical protein
VPVDLDVGDAVVVDETLDHRAQPAQPVPAAFADTVGEVTPRRPDVPCGVDEFVVPRLRPAPHVEQRRLRARSAVVGEQVVGVGRDAAHPGIACSRGRLG